MDRKIRVAAVSYLNTKPLTYGFEQGQMADEIALVFDYPARVAAMLIEDKVDIGLIPVAAIPSLKNYEIISDFCIGASGEVASVCIFSEVPIHEVKSIYLDYQSRTSVALLKILLTRHWKITPELLPATEGYETAINGTTAGLVIGDRALSQRKHSKYIYDLATAWQEMTGLPFLFAAWVANKKLPENFLKDFNHATGAGFEHIAEIVAANPFAEYNLQKYYTVNIDYTLDDKKREAMKVFLSYI